MKFTPLVLGLLLLISCSVQKRKYQKGFYVNRVHHSSPVQKSHHERTKKNAEEITQTNDQAISVGTGDRVQSAGAVKDLKSENIKHSPKNKQVGPDSCDVLLFKDGSEIFAKVYEVGTKEIKYKRCDNINGPSYVTQKSDLFMVKFSNGTKEIMKEEPVVQQKDFQTYKQPKYNPKIRSNHPLALPSLILAIVAAIATFVVLIDTSYSGELPAAATIISVLGSLVAFIIGRIALKQIKAEPDVYKGKGLAIPSTIISGIVLGFWALIVFIIILAFLTI